MRLTHLVCGAVAHLLVPAVLLTATLNCSGGVDEATSEGEGGSSTAGKGGKGGKGGKSSSGGKSGSSGKSGGKGGAGDDQDDEDEDEDDGEGGAGGGIDVGEGGNTGVDCNRKDGKVDQQGCACALNSKQACFVGDAKRAGLGICTFGTQECIAAQKTSGEVGPDNVWGPCTGSGAPQNEVCDDIDQNCNGDSKEGCSCQDKAIEGCTTSNGQQGKRTCEGGQWGTCVPDSTTVCTDGQSQGCTLADGKKGNVVCEQGAWGTCMPEDTSVCTNGQSEGCVAPTGEYGLHECVNGQWGACVPDNTCVAGQTEPCTCSDGKNGTATCDASGNMGACQCGPNVAECIQCIQTECSYEKVAAASQTLGVDTTDCKPAYDAFIACTKQFPNSIMINCDQTIGGCDAGGWFDDCGCGNIIRLAADCATTGHGVGVDYPISNIGCFNPCQ